MKFSFLILKIWSGMMKSKMKNMLKIATKIFIEKLVIILGSIFLVSSVVSIGFLERVGRIIRGRDREF